MPLTISDEQLKSLGLDEHQALIEIACRLFEGEKLELWPAAQLAGLSRVEMENELDRRRIPIYRVNREYWEQEKQSLERLKTPDRKAESTR